MKTSKGIHGVPLPIYVRTLFQKLCAYVAPHPDTTLFKGPPGTVCSTQYNTQSIYSTQYTIHSVQYTVYNTQNTVLSIQYIAYSLQYTVYSTQCRVHSIQYTVYITQYEILQNIIHSTQRAGTRMKKKRRHSTQYTVFSTQ